MRIVGKYESAHLLANAIVKCAADDYQMLLCGIQPARQAEIVTIKSCEAFFHSEWYAMLTNVDPDALMYALKRECEENGYCYEKVKKSHNITFDIVD